MGKHMFSDYPGKVVYRTPLQVITIEALAEYNRFFRKYYRVYSYYWKVNQGFVLEEVLETDSLDVAQDHIAYRKDQGRLGRIYGEGFDAWRRTGYHYVPYPYPSKEWEAYHEGVQDAIEWAL